MQGDAYGKIMAGTQTINGDSIVWSLSGVCKCPSERCATTTPDYTSSGPYMYASTSPGDMGSGASSPPPMGASPTGGSHPEPTPPWAESIQQPHTTISNKDYSA